MTTQSSILALQVAQAIRTEVYSKDYTSTSTISEKIMKKVRNFHSRNVCRNYWFTEWRTVFKRGYKAHKYLCHSGLLSVPGFRFVLILCVNRLINDIEPLLACHKGSHISVHLMWQFHTKLIWIPALDLDYSARVIAYTTLEALKKHYCISSTGQTSKHSFYVSEYLFAHITSMFECSWDECSLYFPTVLYRWIHGFLFQPPSWDWNKTWYDIDGKWWDNRLSLVCCSSHKRYGLLMVQFPATQLKQSVCKGPSVWYCKACPFLLT